MRPIWFRLTASLVLLAGSVAAADDWPRFRGPNGSGVSSSTGIPAEFGPAKNLLWKTALPFSHSSPVVTGDRIFLTATEGEMLITLCLDRKTGRVRWRREIARPRATPIYRANDGATPSPVTDGKNVYVFFLDLGLVSYGPNGKERWRLPLGPFDTFYGLASSPILSGNTLLLLCDARSKPFLIAVDAVSGQQRWRVERTEVRFEGYTSPVIYEPAGGPAQVVVVGANRVDAYAVATGDHIWWVRGLAFFPVGSPVLGNGVVLFSTYGADTPMGPTFESLLKYDSNGDGRLTRQEFSVDKDMQEMADQFGALDPNSDGFLDRAEWETLRNGAVGNYGLVAVRLGGRGDLTEGGIVWREKKTFPNMPSAILYQDVLYIVKTGGIIASMDPLTGQAFKVERTKEAMEEYYSSPVAADDKVFFIGESGKVTVLKAGPQWEILAVNDLGEEVFATPAIAAGRIFVRTRNALYCFGKK